MRGILVKLLRIFLTPFISKLDSITRLNEYSRKVLDLYSNSQFAKIRFWDAPFVEVEMLLPKSGKIYDIGCGEGIFTNFIALSQPKRQVIGYEIDRARLDKANKGVKNALFRIGDANKLKLSKANAIVLFHLLHHLESFSAQEKLIKKCLDSLSPNGKLIIIEADIKPNFKYLLGWFTDCFLVPWIFEKRFYTPVCYRSKNQWRKLIQSLGYDSLVNSAEQGKPFTHIIIEVEK